MTKWKFCGQDSVHPRHKWDTGRHEFVCRGVGVNDTVAADAYNKRWSYPTKDSGERQEYDSGMVRDTQEGKPRFDLVVPDGVPYNAQMLTRWAELMARGAQKYGDRNWEKGRGSEELNRAKASAFRHFMQWFCDETDEDHAAGVFFNIQQVEVLKWRMIEE